MNSLGKDQKYLGRPEGTPRLLNVVRTKDSFVYDDRGKRYIDFFMGWSVGNIGWGNPAVIKAVRNFSGPTYVSPKYYYKDWSDLAELLASIAPGKLVKSFRATGGTEAVEIALQAAMAHTKRSKFISIEGSYHGHSIGAMSVGDSSFREWYSNLLPSCYKIDVPLNEAAARKVVKLLQTRKIAAFICEPIVMNAGVVIPEKRFFDIVQAACKKYGTVFIADEVATGFGHTGKMFASEYFHLKPDIICLAKGLSGGFGVIGATMMTAAVARSFEFSFSFYSTFGWHPLNVAAALAMLRYLKKNQKKLLDHGQVISRYFRQRLNNMKFPYQTELRIKGLAICVDFQNPEKKYVDKLIGRCLLNGLLIADATSTSIVMLPALTLDLKTAKQGLDILEKNL